MVCRYCGAEWQGHHVVEVRPPDVGDPGTYRGKTNCCHTWIAEEPDGGFMGGPRRIREPEYAQVTEYERAWLLHYGLVGELD